MVHAISKTLETSSCNARFLLRVLVEPQIPSRSSIPVLQYF